MIKYSCNQREDKIQMLIELVSVHPFTSPQSVPLANGFLKAYADSADLNVHIELHDFFMYDDVASCIETLSRSCPDAVGFSVYVWNRDFSIDIAVGLRRIHPEIIIFCGGPEITAAPASAMQTGVFDFAISGEGEQSFLMFCRSLVNGYDYSGIAGLVRDCNSVMPTAPVIEKLDLIPSPYLSGAVNAGANRGVLWQLSRGCSFSCDFCFDSRGINGVRYFSFERITAELKHFVKSGVRQVFVLDSTFNLDKKRAKAILRMIRDAAPDIHFHFEIRSEFIDREMARLFSRISCSLQIGLQSSNIKALNLVGRSFSQPDFTAKIAIMNDCGAVFGFDLIYGLPGDTIAGFRQSLDYALSLYPNHLDIFPLAILPGTRLARRGVELKMRWRNNPPYTLESSDSFSETDMKSAAALAASCDIFYTRGKAVAWFNSLVTFLELKPSDILFGFSEWLKERHGNDSKEDDFTDEEIFQLQRFFLKQLLGQGRSRRYIPLILDIVEYHHRYAEVLLAQKPEMCRKRCNSALAGKTELRISPTAKIVHFCYDIEEVLNHGEPHIAWMYKNLSKSGSYAVIYNNGKMICTESIALQYCTLLEQIRDRDGRIDLTATGLSENEYDDFLAFALKEGIVYEILPSISAN